MDYIYNQSLYHHGIKGQKWGVRRYQNEDGSYTPAGEQRYNINTREGRKQLRADYKDTKRDILARKRAADYEYDKKLEKINNSEGSILANKQKRIKLDYDQEKKWNEFDQEKLNAKRAYREQLGKKHIDNYFMKMAQNSINATRKMTYKEYEKDWLDTEQAAIERAAVDKYIKQQSQNEDMGWFFDWDD